MRYEINQEVVFINVEYNRLISCFSSVYIPWNDELVQIEMKKLICMEHKRIPGEYDDEIQYDGFIFKDDKAVDWHNQYPRAHYGQLDDSCNYMVTLSDGDLDEKCCRMTDVTTYLGNIVKGIRDMKKQPNDGEMKYSQQLQIHFDEVDKMLQDQFKLKAAVQPIVWKMNDGTEKSYPDITKVVLVPM